MRILICDDNISAVEILKHITEDYFREHDIDSEVITECSSANVMHDDNFYDIAFLDIEMTQYNGFDVAKHLRDINSEVIVFVITAYPEYLDQAMDIRAFRFFPKPPDRERIHRGLDSAIRHYYENTRMLLSDGNNAMRVYVKDILYIAIEKRKTLIVTKSDDIVSTRTLSEWKEILGEVCFAQPHYSYLVNLQNVEKIEEDMIILNRKNNDIIKVKIAQRKYREFKQKFFNYITG